MPGARRGPTRPRRRFSLSPDRLKLSNGGGVPGIAFGFLFTGSGLLVLVALGWYVLSAAGLAPREKGADYSSSGMLIAILCMLLLGLGHLGGGTMLLWTFRVTVDRAQDVVVVRSGWLGIRRVEQPLSDFQAVASRLSSSRWATRESWFDIVLVDLQNTDFKIGMVSKSETLAREVVGEVADFTGLPVEHSAEYAAACKSQYEGQT